MAPIRAGGAARAPGKPPRKHASSSSTSSPPRPSRDNATGEEGGANLDRDRVRRPNPSFRRRGSMVHTPTPQLRKTVNQNGKVTSQTHSTDKEPDEEDAVSSLSSFSSTKYEDLIKNDEELKYLREQFEELQKKFLEKDEALRALKDTITEMSGVQETVRELKKQILEKDSMVKNANLQLTNMQIKLEEKQAALEKLELEVTASNIKIEELQGAMDSTNFEIVVFLKFFDELSKMHPDAASYDNTTFQSVDQLPYIGDINEYDIQIQKMEEARITYAAAVAVAKENPSEESLAAAAEARFQLQTLVMNC